MSKSLLLSLFALALSPSAFAVNPLDGLPANVVKMHLAATENSCDTDLPSGSESYDLGQRKKLYLVPCIMGAYQGSGRGYITEGNDQSVSQVIILGYNELTNSLEPKLELMEPDYDAKTKTLTTSGLGRGIGDCGQSTVSKLIVDEYGWSVKTTEVRAKVNCDGKMNKWPVVFKQK